MSIQENKAASLVIRYKSADGKWKRSPAARGGNGRLKPGYVVVNEIPVKVDSAVYEIRHYVNRKPVHVNVGRDASDAEVALKQMGAKSIAESAGLTVVEPEQRRTLKQTAIDYMKDAELRGATEALAQAVNVTDEFMRLTRKQFIDEITREDVLKFHEALRKRGMSDRTVSNKHQRLASWLRFGGIDKKVFPPKPKFDKTVPAIYTQEQTKAIIQAAKGTMRLAVLLALKCGLREQELMHLEFSDVDTANRTLTVRSKLKYGFKVKDSEQRVIPVPPDLIKAIEEQRKSAGTNNGLILPTRSGIPNKKMLVALKLIARRAGLNCGQCESCIQRNECEHFTLHQFRRTFCTTILRQGIDLKTAQHLMGHSDLASTLRYLQAASGSELQNKMNQINW